MRVATEEQLTGIVRCYNSKKLLLGGEGEGRSRRKEWGD